LFLNLFNIEASAHNSYFLAITIDEGGGYTSPSYQPEIVYEDAGIKAGAHREYSNIGSLKGAYITNHGPSGEPIPEINYETTEDCEDKYKKVVTDADKSKALVYTFPAMHQDGIGYNANAGQADLNLAQRVVDYPVAHLNEALSQILVESDWITKRDSVKDRESFKNIAARLGNAVANKEQFKGTVNNKSVSISYGAPTAIKDKYKKLGINENDWVGISVAGGEKQYYVYRVKKGYHNAEKDPLYPFDEGDKKYKDKIDSAKGDVTYIGWDLIILQGNFMSDVNLVGFSNSTDLTQPHQLAAFISGFFADMVNSIKNVLGLYTVDELMLNNGRRDNEYLFGAIPTTWVSPSRLLHIVCQAIAWGFIGFSILKVVYQKQLSTINIGERIQLQETIKNLIIAGFLLMAFTLLFNCLLRTNYLLVDLFSETTINSNSYGMFNASYGATGNIGNVIYALAMLIFAIYYNIIYILRAITIAILYGIAPLCIFTLTIGGQWMGTFTTFIKELVGNIYMQSVHAICFAFFSNVALSGEPRGIEKLVILFSFVPITNFVKKEVFGLGDGITNSARSAMAMGAKAAGGALNQAKSSSKNSGNNNSNGGNVADNSAIGQKLDTTGRHAKADAKVDLKDDAMVKTKSGFGKAMDTPLVQGGIDIAKNVGKFGIGASQAVAGVALESIAPGSGGDMAQRGFGKMSGAAGSTIGYGLAGAGSKIPGKVGQKMYNKGDSMTGNKFSANANAKALMASGGVKSIDANNDFTYYELDGKIGPNGFEFREGSPAIGTNVEKNVKAMYDAKYGSGEETPERTAVLNQMEKHGIDILKNNQGGATIKQQTYNMYQRTQDNTNDRLGAMSGSRVVPRNEGDH